MNTYSFDIDKLHAKQLEILVEFDRVCKKFGLTYFLAYGSLLGAVRHKGFIPWDDDIDTIMPYCDYMKLCQVPASEWKSPFFLQNSDTDKNYPFCFTKIRNSQTTLIIKDHEHLDINHGIDVDVYPLLNLADDSSERKRQLFYTKEYMLLQVNEPPLNHGMGYYYAGRMLLSIIPEALKNRMKQRCLSRITQFRNTAECYVVNGNLEVMNQALSSSWFSNMVDGEFEGKVFPIPVGATEWLTKRFGDTYMELPPEDKRGVKLDTFEVVDFEHSYLDYKGIAYCKDFSEARHARNNRWVGNDG